MSGSYFAQWIASIDTGHVITEDDMATLARIRLALHSADKHHRQARAAQAIVEQAKLVAAFFVDGNFSNVSMSAARKAYRELTDRCFGDNKFEESRKLIERHFKPQERADDDPR